MGWLSTAQDGALRKTVHFGLDRKVPLGLTKLKFRRISERLKIKNKNNLK